MAVIAVAAVSVVGMALYALTRPMETPTQKLGDIAQQTAKEGEPRQIVFGIVRPIGGNIVAVQEPPRIERRKQKSGGKGGGGSSSTVEVARRTYAVGICEGPVTGIRRAWRNNKLVYDGRGTEWGAKNNGTFLARFQFYLGDFEQLPSPNLEAIFGAGQVPAMRGTCYMVAKDEDLQDTGGALPQWIFEVERAFGYALTSWVYPIEVIEGGQSLNGLVADLPSLGLIESGASSGGSVLGGSLSETLLTFAPTPEEGQSAGGSVISGNLNQVLLSYSADLPEEGQSNGGSVAAGSLSLGLITYNNYAPEAGESTGGAVLGGSLNAP
tara:strand:- start:4837 stop:5811 length:975 start_codon:yes stop_codon:yes gene_type:complete